MTDVRIEPVTGASEDVVRGLGELLMDAVDSGASVSFMSDLRHEDAADWWRSALGAMTPRSVLLVCRDAKGIVGTVQLQPAWAPNQPHRADVAKLIVHRRARGQGIARALMLELEHHARAQGFTLLVLDTCKGSVAERLYASMGWVRVGVVPDFAYAPDGSLCDTVFFFKRIESEIETSPRSSTDRNHA